MKLDDLSASLPDETIVRLFGFTTAEAEKFLAVLKNLTAGKADQVAVHELPYVEAVEGCKLRLRVRSWDQSMSQVGPSAFECGYTTGTWDNLAGLVEPFIAGSAGYQWLAGGSGQLSLLLSPSEKW